MVTTNLKKTGNISRQSGNNPSTGMEHGKVPPQAPELEEAVLGALLLEKDAFIRIGEILVADSFYRSEHQRIFAAITRLFSEEKPIDILTVAEQLKRTPVSEKRKGENPQVNQLEEIGGPVFLTRLTQKVASAAHIEFHARIIAQKYIQRELIRVSSEILQNSYDDSKDVEDLLDESEAALFEISEGKLKKEATQISPIIDEAIKKIYEARERDTKLSGVPSGFTNLDRITSGWQNSDLVIIAARPSMGKTAFILSMTRNMAIEHNVPVAIFSLEMSNLQLVNRLIVSETEIPAEKIRSGDLEDFELQYLEQKVTTLVEAPIYVDDTPGLSVFELRAKCRRLKSQHDIQIVLVDYLQLMNASGMSPGSREQEVSMISRNLKVLAKELNVPIIALSQLNRGVENRTGSEGKRPQLSDLRESGAIEQDADMVLFIHRPERYGITEDSEGNSLIGVSEIIIAKHRNGAVGDIQLRFKAEQAKFMEFDDYSDAAEMPTGAQTFTSRMNHDKEEEEPSFDRGMKGMGPNEADPF